MILFLKSRFRSSSRSQYFVKVKDFWKALLRLESPALPLPGGSPTQSPLTQSNQLAGQPPPIGSICSLPYLYLNQAKETLFLEELGTVL